MTALQCVWKCNWSVLLVNALSYELHMKEQHMSRLNKSSSLPLLAQGTTRIEIILEIFLQRLTVLFYLRLTQLLLLILLILWKNWSWRGRVKKQCTPILAVCQKLVQCTRIINKQKTTSVSCKMPCTEKLCIKMIRTQFTESPY